MADGSHGGRLSSWLAVTVMVAGFVLGGLGLMAGPMWPLFWAAVAVVAVGGVLALAVGIFSDVVVDEPRDISRPTPDEATETEATEAESMEEPVEEPMESQESR